MRIQRDDMFMEVARLFAARSTCERGQVGAVIVHTKHIIAHGYNGAPSGMSHCTDLGCDVPSPELGCQRAIHAEANAIAYAARVGVSCRGAWMYSTAEPCRKCAELIIQAGIVGVYWENPYRLGVSQFLKDAHVQCEQHTWTPRS